VERGKHKISYIRKPFARRSWVSLLAAAVSLTSCIVSLSLSVRLQGNGELNVAAWGLTSFLFAIVAFGYGLLSFLEKEMNYILAQISTAIGGFFTFLWICLLVVGLAG